MAVAQTSKSVSSSAELFIVKLVERKTKIERCQISTSQICDVNGTSKFTLKSREGNVDDSSECVFSKGYLLLMFLILLYYHVVSLHRISNFNLL